MYKHKDVSHKFMVVVFESKIKTYLYYIIKPILNLK
jgi:hypothetical protein